DTIASWNLEPSDPGGNRILALRGRTTPRRSVAFPENFSGRLPRELPPHRRHCSSALELAKNPQRPVRSLETKRRRVRRCNRLASSFHRLAGPHVLRSLAHPPSLAALPRGVSCRLAVASC